MRLILTILFSLFVFCSDAQIIRANNYYVPFASANLLLDLNPGSAAAYSLRKVRTAYTGAAIRVRRSSDNTEQDIGFVAVDLDTVSLKTFVGANSGFVTTWYDQSGNARNATQTTAANQPRVVNAGAIERDGVQPTLFFDGSNDRLSTSSGITYTTNDQFISIVNSPTSTVTTSSSQMTLISGGTANVDESFIPYGPATGTLTNERLSWLIVTNITNNVAGYGQTTANISGRNLQVFQWYTSTVEIRQNGVAQSLSTSTNGGFAQNTNNRLPRIFSAIGFRSSNASSFFNGKIQEVAIWGSNQNANKTAIESNINSFYAIY
jgi:hypothetical protein